MADLRYTCSRLNMLVMFHRRHVFLLMNNECPARSHSCLLPVLFDLGSKWNHQNCCFPAACKRNQRKSKWAATHASWALVSAMRRYTSEVAGEGRSGSGKPEVKRVLFTSPPGPLRYRSEKYKVQQHHRDPILLVTWVQDCVWDIFCRLLQQHGFGSSWVSFKLLSNGPMAFVGT